MISNKIFHLMNFNVNKHIGKILYKILNIDTKNFLLQQKNITTFDLNKYIAQQIQKYNVFPFLKNFVYHDEIYKFETCISINEELVHTEPNKNKIIKNNDIVKVDIVIGSKCKELVDSARSFYYINDIKNINHERYNMFSHINNFLSDFFDNKIINYQQYIIDIYDILYYWNNSFNSYKQSFHKIFNKTISVIPSLLGHFIQNKQKLHVEPLLYFDEYGINHLQKHKNLKKHDKFCLEPVVIVGNNTNVEQKKDSFSIVSTQIDEHISLHYENTYFFNDKHKIISLTTHK